MKPPPNLKRDPLIIGLAGRAGAGKDTAATYLEKSHGFETFSFAQPLKTMLHALLVECALDYAYLFEPQLKEDPIPGLGVSYRHLAQTLGTDWGRQLIGEDLWLRTAALCLGLPNAPIHDRIVISDVRFPNEAAWIAQQGGVVVRIFRNELPETREHVSEQLLEQIVPWARVNNIGSLPHLQGQLDALIETLEA